MTLRQVPGRRSHREVPVKVNAWVDAGVAELVEALSVQPGLVTVDSCQESSDPGAAYVMFVAHGHSVIKAARRLARELSRSLPDEHYAVRLEWVAGGRRPAGYLIVAPGSEREVAAAIRGLPSSHRTS